MLLILGKFFKLKHLRDLGLRCSMIQLARNSSTDKFNYALSLFVEIKVKVKSRCVFLRLTESKLPK